MKTLLDLGSTMVNKKLCEKNCLALYDFNCIIFLLVFSTHRERWG